MKGLLLKDFYMQKLYLKQYLGTILLFGVIAVMLKSPTYMTFLGLMVGLTQIFSVISIDESGGFTYCLTLPINRRKIVQEKYLLFLIELLLIFTVTAVIGAIIAVINSIPLREWLPQVFGGGAFYLAALSAIIPAALKWKVEKARILLVMMILIPGAVILLGSRLLTPDTRRSLSAWTGGGTSGITAAAVGILLLAVIVTVSYLTSVKIFLKKEF